MEVDEVFEQLARDSGTRLLRLAYQLTHDHAAAEDVVQEALMRMYASWQRRRPVVANPGAYARQAVVHEFLRRRRRHAASEVVMSAVPDLGVDSAAEAVAARDAVWRSLALLSARQRAVLVLRYYEDLPDGEIATVLGARPATVRSLAARALEQLRSMSDLDGEPV